MMTNGICKKKIQMKDIRSSSNETMDYSTEEDYFESISSPTDSSEDSVEVKICPIQIRNKRKCAEPRKVQEKFTGPLKKRMCLKVKAEVSNTSNLKSNSNSSNPNSSDNSHPFRPWSPKCVKLESSSMITPDVVTSDVMSFAVPSMPSSYDPRMKLIVGNGYFRPPSPPPINSSPDFDKPVALIKKHQSAGDDDDDDDNVIRVKVEKCDDVEIADVPSSLPPRVPIHPQISKLSAAETERIISHTNEIFPSLNTNKSDQQQQQQQQQGNKQQQQQRGGEQRNYKNMTRERRIEANARERTRVHTISAAFDTLRKSIPAYSHNQKLSKLSVLRIACSYIMTLSSIVTDNEKGTSECVESVTKTIQREGKLRKKKDDND